MEKKKCPQCGLEFTPARWWQEFCCVKHRQDFHNNRYRLAGVGPYTPRDERLNGHDVAQAKFDLVRLGLAPSPKPKMKRRKLTTQDASEVGA